MEASNAVFEVIFNDQRLPVRELSIAGQTMYVVPVKDGKPLVLTRAMSAGGDFFWTSVPEGRQALAICIGKLIDAHFRKVS